MWTKYVFARYVIKQSYRIGEKSDILLVVFSQGSAETNVSWGGKLNGNLMASYVRNILDSCQKLSKSDNWFSSYSRKCQRCFFGTQRRFIFIAIYSLFIISDIRTVNLLVSLSDS